MYLKKMLKYHVCNRIGSKVSRALCINLHFFVFLIYGIKHVLEKSLSV